MFGLIVSILILLSKVMKYMRTEQKIMKKALSVFLIAAMVLPTTIPFFAFAQIFIEQGKVPVVSLESVIQIPEVTVNGINVYQDISRVDWSQGVSINGKRLALNSEEVLNVLAIPSDVKDVVRAYRDEKTSIDRKILMWPWDKTKQKGFMDEGIQDAIARVLIERDQLPIDYLNLKAQGYVESGDNVIDISDFEVMNPNLFVPIETTAEIIDVKPVEIEAKNTSFLENVGSFVMGAFGWLVARLKPGSAYADVATVNEAAIGYILNEQNADGSWGIATSTRFMTTVSVLDALQSNGITGTTTNNGVAWLESYTPENNDYLADQAKILARAGVSTSSLPALVRGLDQDTGGFRFNKGYEGDAITTAKAIQALQAADFEDEGDPNVTASLALHYLINKQRFDNGWSIVELGSSPISATSEVVEALLLWKHRALGAIEIDDTLDPAVSFLAGTQDPDGTWNEDVLNTALAYHAVKAAGEIPTYQLETVEYFEEQQEGNGSFDNDIYKTAKVLKALSLATNSGELVVSDIVPIGTLQTGTTTQFNIVMSNPGNVAVDTGKLHIIADDFNFATFDFEENNITVNASSTVNLTVGINNTRNLQGDVIFKVFVEGTNSIIHPSSRYQETLTYVSDPANRPGLPMYYVAYKNVSSGNAAITWRWPIKNDPKLKNVVLMWRVASTTTWSTANVTSTTTTSAATVSGLTNNTVYEATLGTSDVAGNTYFYSGSNISNVKVSSSTNTYKNGVVGGTVKALDGTVATVDVIGTPSVASTTTDVNGDYAQTAVPWGTGYARVSDFRHESYTTDYSVADNTVGDINVYTNLKPDTQNPTVSNVLIVGESDYVMENKERELIQYTVDDDIKFNGNGVVQSVSLYYYNPHNAGWHLIGTEQGNLSGTRTYQWNIPGSLVGTGYKVKVVARDFAGKDSTVAEWGPFELTAGNASPSFNFIAPGINFATTTSSTYTIKWADDDVDSNATTTLSYDPDNNPSNGNHALITTVLEDDPLDEYQLDLSTVPMNQFYVRADGVDGHNATTTVYSSQPVARLTTIDAAPIQVVTESGQRYADFKVTRSGGATDWTLPLTVNYSVVGNSSQNGNWDIPSGVATIATSTASTTVRVHLLAAFASSTSGTLILHVATTSSAYAAGRTATIALGSSGNNTFELPTANNVIYIDGAGGTDSLTLLGAIGNNSFTVSSTTVAVNGRAIAMAGIEQITFDSGSGDDDLVINNVPTGVTKITLDSGTNTASGSDTITLNGGIFDFDGSHAPTQTDLFFIADGTSQTMTINDAAIIFLDDASTYAPHLSVTANADAILRFYETQHIDQLTVRGSLETTMNHFTGGLSDPKHILVMNTLAIEEGGKLDIGIDELVVKEMSVPAVGAYIINGFHDGYWDGSGIVSTLASGDPVYSTGIGYSDADTMDMTTFGTESVDSTDVLVKPTYYGDSNFDGQVDEDDYDLLQIGLNGGGTGWRYGDYDYSGDIQASDETLYEAGLNSIWGEVIVN